MRMMIAASALLVLGACNVSTDDNGVTVQYDQNTAENAVADVSNTAEDIAGDLGNDLGNTADRVEDRADNTNVDVDVDTNTAGNQQ